MHSIATFRFLPNIPPKRGLPLSTGASCEKKQAVEIWPIKNSALCYVNVRLPGLTLFRMEQKLWLTSAQFNWIFKQFPMASGEDFKLKVLNWTCACVSSLHSPKKTKKNSANSISVLSTNVQKAKNCSFLVPVHVPCCFSPKSAKLTGWK